jgi:ABC-type amino acid transport substrate-binding protein
VAAPLGAVPSIAATVPEEIMATGRLVIGVNVPYAPMEFKNADGDIVGVDVDLMNVVARTLGLVPDYRETGFEAIIPSVRAGDFNVGMSSFTDTKEREGSVDFVTYFEAGTLWAQRPGSGVDPANACGLRVGVAYATLQETDEIPAKSEACGAAGQPPIEKVVYVQQDELTAGLIAGEVDAMSADSPARTHGTAYVCNMCAHGYPQLEGSAQQLGFCRAHCRRDGRRSHHHRQRHRGGSHHQHDRLRTPS